MRHFGYIAPDVRKRLFWREPSAFSADSSSRIISAALGATLYSPANRPYLAEDVLKQAERGVVSMVICLEDSIDDGEVISAEKNLINQFVRLSQASFALPLLFIRVRTPQQIPDITLRLGNAASIISGFALPKFTEERGVAFLEALAEAEYLCGRPIYAMPILESPDLLYLESRVDALSRICRVLEKYRDRVLALRLGVTDFCSSYGLRRGPGMTAYDIQIVASMIADVVNVLSRADGTGFTVTGPVWEYFPVQERVFKHQLRQSPFAEVQAMELRRELIEHSMDGLLREISLDQVNGLMGKTCIHPSHVLPVHALSVVSHEEFSDAQDILKVEHRGGGVLRSAYTNKMNEVKPHRTWAERIVLRAELFGVANQDVGFAELLTAGQSALSLLPL